MKLEKCEVLNVIIVFPPSFLWMVVRIKLFWFLETKYFLCCLSDKAGKPSCFPSKQSDEEPCVGVKIAQNKGGQYPSLPSVSSFLCSLRLGAWTYGSLPFYCSYCVSEWISCELLYLWSVVRDNRYFYMLCNSNFKCYGNEWAWLSHTYWTCTGINNLSTSVFGLLSLNFFCFSWW